MNYRVVFQQTMQLVQRRRVLWVFGLLAALGGGGFNFSWSVGNLDRVAELPLGTHALLTYFFSSPAVNTLLAYGLALGLAGFLLHTFAEGALITLVNANQEHRTISLADGVRAGWQLFPRILVVRIVLAIPVFIVGVLTLGSVMPAISRFFTGPTGERLFNLDTINRLAGPGTTVFLFGVLISGLDIGVERAIALDHMPIGQAFVHGVKLFVTKIGHFAVITVWYVVLGLIISMVYTVIMALVMFLFVLPQFGGDQVGFEVFQFLSNSLYPASAIALVFIFAFGAWVSAYTSAVWTLAYRQWRAGDVYLDTAPDDTYAAAPKPAGS